MANEAARDILERRWEEIGFGSLMPEEQDFLVLWFLNTEVFNGGLVQYFDNSAGDTALQALSALSAVGAIQIHDILKRAIGAFDVVGGYTNDRWTRIHRMRDDHAPGELTPTQKALDALTEEYYEAADWPDGDFLEATLSRVQKLYETRGIA